ncbi:MAG: metallophosphoesterase, partial [Calditrichaeota bacterium]|nr:metallophosphoesterase [Calditrichota bacterium]
MNIAHLSDFHICMRHKPENFRKTRFIIKEALKKGAEHFILSGDIVDNPHPENFAAARRILDEFNLLHPDRLTVIIGNHEIYGGVHLVNEITEFPSRCLNTDFLQRVLQFKDYFGEAFENTIRADRQNPFPFLKFIDDIAIIGLNSIAPYSRWSNLFASRGKISSDGYSKLEYLLSKTQKSRFRIVSMHHHVNSKMITAKRPLKNWWERIEWQTLKFKRKRKLLRFLSANNVELLLHGHVHETAEY